MSLAGKIEVVGVVSIDYVDEGQSLCFIATDTIPPYGSSTITFKNTYVTQLYQVGGADFPLIIADIVWQEINDQDKQDVLSEHRFPFFNEVGDLMVPKTTLVLAHLEGDLVGDVIAEQVVVEIG